MDNIDSLTVPCLCAELSSRGLAATGQRPVLRNRIMVALALLVDTDQSAEAAALRDGEARGPDAPALIDGEALRTAVVSVVAETLPTLLASVQPQAAPTPPSQPMVDSGSGNYPEPSGVIDSAQICGQNLEQWGH